jgi:flavin-dependent dehydrogenase
MLSRQGLAKRPGRRYGIAMAKLYDVAILGGTPAAYAAACHLTKSRKGIEVAVISPPAKTTDCPLADWVPRGFFEPKFLTKSFQANSGAVPFKRVCYHNSDLSNQMDQIYHKPAGHFFRAGQLAASLKDLAKDLGATVRNTSTDPAIQLEEEKIRLVGTIQAHARMLIIAHDRPSEIISELSLPARTVPHSSLVVAGLDVPLGKGVNKDLFADELHVVEMRERSELGLFFRVGNLIHLRMVSKSPAAGNRADELSGMVAHLQQSEILPAGMLLGKATGAVWHPPAGVALEMETHVAKRCILAGSAGGFAESITGHTTHPSVLSALLACDVILKALAADDPQDVLMGYKPLWRNELADYLRPPNTSLHMLLPLLFANRRMASRFSSALLFGENI